MLPFCWTPCSDENFTSNRGLMMRTARDIFRTFQTSKNGVSAKIVNSFQPLIIFAKCSILNVWQGSQICLWLLTTFSASETSVPSNISLNDFTAWKVSVFRVILVRIQSESGKIQTRITPNTDTLRSVYYHHHHHRHHDYYYYYYDYRY